MGTVDPQQVHCFDIAYGLSVLLENDPNSDSQVTFSVQSRHTTT
jgi:hypothetical protein